MAEPSALRRTFRRFFDDYLSAVGGRSAFGRLINEAVTNPDTRRRLVHSPKQTLAAAGVTLPEGLNLRILENTDQLIHIVLPPFVASDGGRSSPS